MRTLSCKDLGEQSCDYAAKGENDDKVMDEMIAHARIEHPDKTKNKSEEELKNMMRPEIRNE